MYWYISFLRPPPVSVEAGGSIRITTQVANDLRTELKYTPTDIACTWQRVYPVASDPQSSSHLTTFIPPASTYAVLDVPIPRDARLGERWRLGLFVDPDGAVQSTRSSGNGRDDGRMKLADFACSSSGVVGVWSEAIEIVRPDRPSTGSGPLRGVPIDNKRSKTAGKPANARRGGSMGADQSRNGKEKEAPKQTRIAREWEIVGTSKLRVVEQTSFDLDKKIWDSGLALSAWLWTHLPCRGATHGDELAAMALRALRRPKLRVLELGSGTGLVSIALSLVLRQLHADGMVPQDVQLTATDLESAIPLMQENLSLNGLASRPLEDQPGLASLPASQSDSGLFVRAEVLDWGQSLPGWVGQGDWPDVIIAADVTYNTASFPALLATVCTLLAGPVVPAHAKQPMLLLAYKERDAGERELWRLLAKRGVQMKMVDTVQGAEAEGAVEIWVGL